MAFVGLELDESLALAGRAVADADSMVDRLNGLATAGLAAMFLGRTSVAIAIAEQVAPYAYEVLDADPMPAACAASSYAFALVLAGRIDEAAATFQFLLDQDQVRVGGAAGSA